MPLIVAGGVGEHLCSLLFCTYMLTVLKASLVDCTSGDSQCRSSRDTGKLLDR